MPQKRPKNTVPKINKEGAIISGYWHFKTHEFSAGLQRFFLSCESDNRSRHCFGVSSPLCTLKVFQMFFNFEPPCCWSVLSWPQGHARLWGFLQSRCTAGLPPATTGLKGRMETEICAKIYSHGVCCEPKFESLQRCMFSSEQRSPVARLCLIYETVEYSLHSWGIAQHWILLFLLNVQS